MITVYKSPEPRLPEHCRNGRTLQAHTSSAAREDDSLLPKPIVSIASGERAIPVSLGF